MEVEPSPSDLVMLTWRGIEIGPATLAEARVILDILATLREDLPIEEKEQLVRSVLGVYKEVD